MTEIAVRDSDDRAPATATPGPVDDLIQWAERARAAHALAVSLCSTTFVPQHFRGKPAEGAAAILTGYEMGMSPMAALRAIYVISGTPSMYAAAMRAVAQSQGHKVWVEPGATPQKVVVRGHRAGEPDKVQESVWTMERAKTAGLLSNQQYTKNPQNMLTARGTAEVCRLIAADALHGMLSVEEAQTLDPRPVRAEAVETAPVSAREILGQPEPAAEVTPAAAPEQPTDETLWPEPARIPGGGE